MAPHPLGLSSFLHLACLVPWLHLLQKEKKDGPGKRSLERRHVPKTYVVGATIVVAVGTLSFLATKTVTVNQRKTERARYEKHH